MSEHSYRARVERDEDGWWVGRVEDLAGAHTQARTLAQLRHRLAEAVAVVLEVGGTEVEPEAITIALDVRLPQPARRATDRATKARTRARTADEEAATATAQAVAELRAAGLSMRDAAEVLNLSHQRVAQLA